MLKNSSTIITILYGRNFFRETDSRGIFEECLKNSKPISRDPKEFSQFSKSKEHEFRSTFFVIDIC